MSDSCDSPEKKKPKLEIGDSVEPKLVDRKWLEVRCTPQSQDGAKGSSSNKFKIMQFNTLADGMHAYAL